jgi:predicted peptidase
MKVFSMLTIGLCVVLLSSVAFTADPALKDITLYATGGAYLTPHFTGNQFGDQLEYTVDVNSDIAQLEIEALTLTDDVTLTINDEAVESGARYVQKLEVGENVCTLVATGPDGTSTTYTITITKEDIAPVVEKFLKLTYTDPDTGATMPYRLFVPEMVEEGKTYPLVLFLHGGGERGDDNEKQITANQGPTIWAKPEEQEQRPCFVLAPQARNVHDGGFGITRNAENKISLARVFEVSPDSEMAMKVLKQVMSEYPVDASRVYTTGLSQGGYGTWDLNLKYPDVFAAMVPICGGGDPALAANIVEKPIWAFHAAADFVIPVSHSRNIIQALRNLGGNPHYTEYPVDAYIWPIAHFAWVPAYQSVKMREWLFNQKKPSHQIVRMKSEI